MAISLQGKKILITGSTDGLGRLLAIQLASKGADIIIHGKEPIKIDETLSELKAINSAGNYQAIICDLTKSDEVIAQFQSKINSIFKISAKNYVGPDIF